MLLGCLIGLPISHLCISSQIAQYKAVELTIEQSRNLDISDLERAAIQQTVCKWNAWLAGMQYWNNKIFFGWFVPDAVNSFEFIK